MSTSGLQRSYCFVFYAGAAAIFFSGASTLNAAPFYGWADSYQDQIYYPEAAPPRPARRAPAVRKDLKAEKLAAEGAKPQAPLVIAISIQRQQMKIYDANGLFAQSAVSTGMSGFPTPMGAFSVIQKHKYHRSNIYSGAPMPYMQRITWSGVAMHAGVLPGYPASHGCIRLPMSFAMKLWNYTRMGARVVVTPGEVSPSDISHPTLASLRPSAATVAVTPDIAAPSLAIKTADASGAISVPSPSVVVNASAAASIALRPGIDVAATVDDGSPPAPVNAAIPVIPEREKNDTTTEPQKNQARIDSPPQLAPAAPKRTGPVAIFVSRKDGKVYVRHNFAPLFDMPIAIASNDHPLGTHIFTARRAADDDKGLVWSAVTLPSIARQASLQEDKHDDRRRRAGAVTLPAMADNTAADALDRIAIPAELMARLGDPLPPGSSLMISDQGIQAGETGEGTDFIVRLR